MPGSEYVANFSDALAAWTAIAGRTRGFIVLARCDMDAAAAQLTVPVKPGSELVRLPRRNGGRSASFPA